MQPLKFYLVTDTHFRPNSMCEICDDYNEYIKYEQMCLAENEAILKATFDKIAEDKETNIVIIPGDVSKNGEKQSHIGFIEYLDKLRDSGKKIFVITARHDFNSHATAFVNGGWNDVEGTEKSELADLYKDYGYGDALSRHSNSLSYVAQVAPGYRMLALDSDGETDLSNGGQKGYLSDDILSWAKEQIDAAKSAGDEIFAICHYPIIPPSPFFEIVSDARLKNREQVIDFLADNGVNFALTGHMHIQSVNVRTTSEGNMLWDVCTSALVGSPAMYRKIVYNGDTAEIKSIEVPDFEWDTKGMTNEDFFDEHFKTMIRNKINRMLDGGKGFVKFAKKLAKKIFNSITLGTIARICFVRIDKSLKKIKLIDFAGTIGVNIFKGDQPFVKGTKEYDAVTKVLNRFRFIIKKVEPKLSKDKKLDLMQMVVDSIGNNKGFSDNNVTIKLR